jgi:hypothetical protein
VGSDGVVMVSAGFTVRVKVFVAVFELLSVTLNVMLGEPLAVGVPLIVPPLERLNPEGRLPLWMLHVYPLPLPPLAANVVV